jgi:hypothetical protein
VLAGAGCLVVLLSAGCAAGQNTALPPEIAQSSYPLFASASTAPVVKEPASQPADFPARLVLMRFLRGAGAGNTKVCGWVSPEYDEKAFSTVGGCARWVASIKPVDRAKLKLVTVPEATGDPKAWTVQASSLVWPKGKPTTPKAAAFVLRKPGSRWLLSV